MEDAIAGISAATHIEKKKMTNLNVLNEAFDYAKPSSFSRGLRPRVRQHRCPAHLGHRLHRRRRRHRTRRRFPRPAQAHLSQHHRPAGGRGRQLARHRPHHLLPARHRSRLRRLRRRAHRVLRRAWPRSPARPTHRHPGHPLPPRSPHRDRSHRRLQKGVGSRGSPAAGPAPASTFNISRAVASRAHRSLPQDRCSPGGSLSHPHCEISAAPAISSAVNPYSGALCPMPPGKLSRCAGLVWLKTARLHRNLLRRPNPADRTSTAATPHPECAPQPR